MDTDWRSKMQIWKKNFLTIYALFLFIIYGGLFMLDGYISQNELRQWVEHAKNSERSISYLAAGLKDEEFSRIRMNLDDVAKKYYDGGTLVEIRLDSYIAANYIPDELEGVKAVEIKTYKNQSYLIVREERLVGDNVIEVDYAENLMELSRIQRRRTWIFGGAGLAFSAGLGVLLYYMMRRINRPVNQIAHELRTPLTGIRGYAEYIMMGKLTEEDRFFAAKQIVDSAGNLESITEKLLIMGNVREGALSVRRMDIGRLLLGLREKYPDIETECRLDYLNGDETLVKCLLENLTSNARSAGQQVKVTADEEGIRVWNDGEPMDEKLLRAVNKGQELNGSRMGKHGYGIQVCREIAMAHGWRLHYVSSKENGTTAVCQFRQL